MAVLVTDGPGVSPSAACVRATVHAIDPSLTPLTGPGRRSTRFEYFTDGQRLLVLARGDTKPGVADQALAYGLSYLLLHKLTQLLLALPRGLAYPTLWRLPWLDADVQVFEFQCEGAGTISYLAECAVPTRRQILGAADQLGGEGCGARARSDFVFNSPFEHLDRQLDYLADDVYWRLLKVSGYDSASLEVEVIRSPD